MTDRMTDGMSDGMSDPVVQYDVVDGVAWLTINRPNARNALSAAVRAGLFDGVERFNRDESARVLVLTGVGEVAFCAGADLKEMAAAGLEVPPADFLPQFGRNVQVDKPTIAAVNGLAYAGGFLLAQMCDLCVAADHARFAITEVKVGRGAPWAAPLPTMIPPRVALEILLTGEPIDAARAHQIGLVNRVVPAAELRDTVQQLATMIAANAPLSVLAAKEMVRAVLDPTTSDPFTVAEEIWRPVYLSDDAQEGPRAFREKRAPRWTGR
jgi:enoyl-CoA hydratase/carnithine racemase